ncbi:MAG: DUF86 domain-containing protein [Reyranellaceae bacterium]
MTQRLVGHYLLDILEAIDGATAAVQGQTLESFRGSWTIRHAVQRAIEIISEASRRIPDEMLAAHPEIPWPQIRGIGNILRHEYRHVDDTIVWRVVMQDFPPLRAAAQQIFKGLDEDPEA